MTSKGRMNGGGITVTAQDHEDIRLMYERGHGLDYMADFFFDGGDETRVKRRQAVLDSLFATSRTSDDLTGVVDLITPERDATNQRKHIPVYVTDTDAYSGRYALRLEDSRGVEPQRLLHGGGVLAPRPRMYATENAAREGCEALNAQLSAGSGNGRYEVVLLSGKAVAR